MKGGKYKLHMTKENKEKAFMAGFAVYLIILIQGSVHLSAGSRDFPRPIIVGSIILIILKLLIFKFPRLKFLDPSGEIAVKPNLGEMKSKEQQVEKEKKGASRLYIVSLFLLWLATFPVGIYLIGYLPTMAIWMFVFMIGISKIKLRLAIILSVCTFVGI